MFLPLLLYIAILLAGNTAEMTLLVNPQADTTDLKSANDGIDMSTKINYHCPLHCMFCAGQVL